MNRQDILQLRAERQFIESRLAEIPAKARLTRRSLEARLRLIQEQLASAKITEQEPTRVQLTFRGKPVIGSHGVFADFGMKATSAFIDAVTAVAGSFSGPLSATGPIPNREQNQLLITNTAIGSFGFELEEYIADQLPLDHPSPVAQAIDVTRDLLRSTLASDDELADSAAAIDPRALASVRNFLETLSAHEAICALKTGEQCFSFQNVTQVRSSLARLSQDNLHEEELWMTGSFQGILPKRRNYEFLLKDGEIITGQLSPMIASPEIINQHLYEETRIQVMSTRVGKGRPRYMLLSLPPWP